MINRITIKKLKLSDLSRFAQVYIEWYIGPLQSRKSQMMSGNSYNKILDSLQKSPSNKHIQSNQIMLTRKLGNGASSIVYVGTLAGCHTNTDKVAVKEFKVDKEEYYENEKSILEKLSEKDNADKYIIKYYGYIDDCMNKSLVIEYMAGSDLVSYLEKTNHAKPAEQLVLKFAASIARSLDFIHGYDIIHCDVKCDNILITKNNEVKLCDFGFAKTKEEIKVGLHLRGTPEFVAPELFDSEENQTPYSEKSDMYAYAFVLYEFGTARRPYPKNLSDGAILLLAWENQRPSITPDICPANIASLIKPCWEQSPKDRPYASEVINKIEAMQCKIT